jgi:hypothetical protein
LENYLEFHCGRFSLDINGESRISATLIYNRETGSREIIKTLVYFVTFIDIVEIRYGKFPANAVA